MDDDLQHDPKDIKLMYEYFTENDVDGVVGFCDADETVLRNVSLQYLT